MLPSTWVYLGEFEKIVAASTRRVAKVEDAGRGSVSFTLRAAAGEVLQLAFVPPSGVAALWRGDEASAIQQAVRLECRASSQHVEVQCADAACSC